MSGRQIAYHLIVWTVRQYSNCQACNPLFCSGTWNSLPTTVTDSDSLWIFKSRLKSVLFSRACNWYTLYLPPAPLKLRPNGAIQSYYYCCCCCCVFLTLGTYNPEGDKKLKCKYKIGYDQQSVQSIAGKLSCKIAALKHCTKIEILWYMKLVSRASPVFSEILLPRSSRRWRADALKTPKVCTAIGLKM